MLVKPPRLRSGDTVAIVSLSAGISAAVPHRHERGKQQLAETFGINVIDAPHALRDDAWLHANPEARADDLHWAIADDRVNGIVTTIGGDDSIRVVPYLDLSLIRDHPKVFMGFSDTTVQHLANRAAGIVSFYGPSLLAGFAENCGMTPYVVDAVRQAVFTAEPFDLTAASEWTEEFLDWHDSSLSTRARQWWPNPGWSWLQGSAPVEGELIGGCIEVLEMAKGTSIWPPKDVWDGAVFHIELSEDAPSPAQVLYWLRNYTATGILPRIGALLLSRPDGYPQRTMFELWEKVRLALREAGREDMPVVANLDYGHTAPIGVLPLGCRVRVDPIAKEISVLEAGVS